MVSIHAAREGGDLTMVANNLITGAFQSTPPARAATQLQLPYGRPDVFQSTPPARAATRVGVISNALLEFQSTPPARAATKHRIGYDG